jgi:hypothetical protein
MAKLDDVTGSPDRSNAVLEMVGEAIRDGDPSFEAVAAKVGPRIADKRLNKTFVELYEDEYLIALAMLQPAEFDPAEVQVEPMNGSAGSHIEPAEKVPGPIRGEQVADQDTPTMTLDEANAELARRKEALMAAKKAWMLAEDEQQRCRELLEAATIEWTGTGPSSDSIRRAEIQAINRDRANKVEHGNQHRTGPSVIDQQAGYRGDASTFLRKQMRYGSHHRAVFIDGEWRQPGRRGAKLPSEL